MMKRFFPKAWLSIWLIVATVIIVVSSASAFADPSLPAWAKGQSQGEDLVITLVTFSPGDEIVSWFGHTALVVEDTRHRQSRLYNYGMFTFDEKMLLNFAMGRLWFWVGDAPVKRTLELYKRENRDVRLMELNLSAQKRLEIAQFMAHNVRPENREYLYHHYLDNCATRVRDVIDRAIGGQLSDYAKKPGRMTLREHTRRHSAHNPPMDMLLMFLMNGGIDSPITIWEEMFLPEELEYHVREFEYMNEAGERVPLVKQETIYFESDRPAVPQNAPVHWPWALVLGSMLGGVALGLWRWEVHSSSRWPRVMHGIYQALIGLMLGIPGSVLALMWLATEHEVTYWNQNLFVANPLTLLAFPLGILWAFGMQRARQWLASLWLVLGALSVLALIFGALGGLTGIFQHDTSLVLALALPLIASLASAAYFYEVVEK